MKPIASRAAFRLLSFLLLLALTLPALYAFHVRKVYGDVWQQLGLSERDGAQHVQQSFLEGWLQFYGTPNLRTIATGDRKAVALDLLEYTKRAVQTEDFKKQYEARRIAQKPTEPKKARTEDQIRKELIDGLKTGMDNMTKAAKDAKPDLKAIYESNIVTFKQQMDEYAKADNPSIKYMAEAEVQQYAQRQKEYEAAMKKWEQNYPATASGFVKVRLQEVLDKTKDIDYGAALVEKYGKKRFVNPAYESKPSNWKLGFRAGKDVTETVRSYVQAWIREL